MLFLTVSRMCGCCRFKPQGNKDHECWTQKRSLSMKTDTSVSPRQPPLPFIHTSDDTIDYDFLSATSDLTSSL